MRRALRDGARQRTSSSAGVVTLLNGRMTASFPVRESREATYKIDRCLGSSSSTRCSPMLRTMVQRAERRHKASAAHVLVGGACAAEVCVLQPRGRVTWLSARACKPQRARPNKRS